MRIPVDSAGKIRFGDFEVDLRTRELRTNGRKLILQEQPFQILVALLERPGQLLSREELTNRLWPPDTFVDFEHSLNKAVNRLREALQDSADQPRVIETLPRRGYRLIAPLETTEPPTLESAGEQSVKPETKSSRSSHGWYALGMILSVACLLAAWLWIRHRDAKPSAPQFRRLSFGRGMIRSARFAPDGQSVVYGAAWDGKPPQLFWTKAGSIESRALGVEGDILAISRSGEMAVLQSQHFGIIGSQGTLVLMSLTGSAPRKLIDDVQDADWSPDGSKLVITHFISNSHWDLEFPPGKVLYETTGGAWLSHPRISPRGDRIAFLEHPREGDDSGFPAILDLTNKKKIVSTPFESVEGLAWNSSGDAIWFSGRDLSQSGPRGIYELTNRGIQRLVHREAGSVTLRDVSRSGSLALTRDTARSEVFSRMDGEKQEREISWLDNSFAEELASDGKTVVLSVQGEASGTGYAIYLRKTDGTPAVRLGDGYPSQFSPDGKWVLATSQPLSSAPQLLLLPTGAGQPITLTNDSIGHYSATLLPGGNTVLFVGKEPEHARRNWVQSVTGGKPVPITPEGTVGERVSPDGKWLVAVDSNHAFWIYPVDGGTFPKPLPGIALGEDIIRWSGDGKYVFAVGTSIPASIYRVDVRTGHRQPVHTIVPRDPAGLWSVWPVLITADGKSYVYSDYRILSELYLANGLR